MKLVRWVGAAVLLAPAAARAQEASTPTVTVSASGRVEKTPGELQFSFTIVAKGEDVAKAVEALEGRRKEAQEKMKGLGVAEKDMLFGAPVLQKRGSDQAARQRAAVNRLKKKKDDEKAPKEPTVVSLSITGRLPIKEKEKAACFVEAEGIKEKVKAAGLVPKEKKAGEGEEEPGEEEETVMWTGRDGEERGLEDGFAFMYRALVDEKDTREAAAKAMADARKRAELAAQAAGKKLGDPVNVDVVQAGEGGPSMDEMYQFYGRRMRTSMRFPSDPSDEGIVASAPDALQVVVSMRVTYSLK